MLYAAVEVFNKRDLRAADNDLSECQPLLE